MSPMKSSRGRRPIRRRSKRAVNGVISGGVAGEYANYSVFDVESNAELHDMLIALPLFTYMKISVTPLCCHPSSIRDGDV
ncbi:muconolactone D-isomerase (plasmid) [Caballeronia sp. S22]